ncbi:MAG: DUF2950 domain-containing protein [Verrucomicrobiota bacterium]
MNTYKMTSLIKTSPAIILAALLAIPAFTSTFAEEKPEPAKPRIFATPEEASKALLEATQSEDRTGLRVIFGPDVQEILSGDKVQEASEIAAFSKAIAKMCNLSKVGEDKVILNVGEENWPFPIPLVKKEGQWQFDVAAGKDEILNRRIGKDELATIDVMQHYVNAQREYASVDRDGSGVLKYAQKIISTPGRQDGLFWEPSNEAGPSPFGPLLAKATSEGYDPKKKSDAPQPYHGYYYKVLKAQGSAAPGGKYNYVINGNMIAGFALVAWPSIYDQSGIMTFIVNQQGKVFQKNCGPETASVAARMTEYNPDKTWILVGDESPSPAPQSSPNAGAGKP